MAELVSDGCYWLSDPLWAVVTVFNVPICRKQEPKIDPL